MASLTVTVKPLTGRRIVRLELDANHFERLAAEFGLFNPDFIKSLDRAEADWRAGRVRKLKTFRDLRKSI